MSYPRKLHVLIVEDEEPPRRSHEKTLELLGEDYPLCSIVVACSFEDGKRRLEESAIYHLLILDLGLPAGVRDAVLDGVEPGLELLKMAATRDAYPIPSVLVVSGRLGGSTSLPHISSLLDSFFFGKFVNKGDMSLGDRIAEALNAALRYGEIGIHIQDSGPESFPTLTPREDDLLRKCAASFDCLGLDLAWWGAEALDPRFGTASTGLWKKVLVGNFLLDNNLGRSNPTFFKFEPTQTAEFTRLSAQVLGMKLRHVKVSHAASLAGCSLLVTESVSSAHPIALDEFLRRPSKEILPSLPTVMQDVVDQIEHLGSVTEKQHRLSELLWKHHDTGRLADGLEKIGLQSSPVATSVLEVFARLSSSQEIVWAKQRNCNHGDLHARNIAVDASTTPAHAYIFDAGAVSSDINVRDLAELEISLLLFQAVAGSSLVDECKGLYSGNTLADTNAAESIIDVARNTRAAISEIRKHVDRLAATKIYAVLLFDQILIQVGGAMVEQSHNKVCSLNELNKLLNIVIHWMADIAPD